MIVLGFAVSAQAQNNRRGTRKGRPRTAVKKTPPKPQAQATAKPVEKWPRVFEGELVFEEDYKTFNESGEFTVLNKEWKATKHSITVIKGNKTHTYNEDIGKHVITINEQDSLISFLYYDGIKDAIRESVPYNVDQFLYKYSIRKEWLQSGNLDTIMGIPCKVYEYKYIYREMAGEAPFVTEFTRWETEQYIGEGAIVEYPDGFKKSTALILQTISNTKNDDGVTYYRRNLKGIKERSVSEDEFKIPEDYIITDASYFDPEFKNVKELNKVTKVSDRLREQNWERLRAKHTDTRDFKTYTYEKDADWEE
ncbi:MAG: hypothetical protein IJ816_01580 [Alloprevotella sp.]|nr:hypothetical protein [Alloprevotella sp.]